MKVTVHWCKDSNYQQVNRMLLCMSVYLWAYVRLPCFVFTSSQIAVVFTLLVPLCTSFLNLIGNFCCCCCCCFFLVLVQNWILISSCYTFCMPLLSMGKAKQTHIHTHTQRVHTHLEFVAYSPFDCALSAVTCTMCCMHMFSKSHSSAARCSSGIDSGHCVRCCCCWCVWKWESGRCIFISNGILRIQLRMQYLLN